MTTAPVASPPMANRREYGTGSLWSESRSYGEAWVCQYWENGRQRKKVLGRKRAEGTRTGLTKSQAETEFRKLRHASDEQLGQRAGERPTVGEVARAYITAARKKGRKPSTLQDLESHARVHLTPFFADRAMAAVTPEDVQDFVWKLEADELAPKTVRNVVGTLSAFFNFAKAPKRRWAAGNPCEGVEIEAGEESDDFRFLTLPEVDTLIEHACARDYRHHEDFQALDRVLYLTAAMTGLRLGELVALRWQDVDWPMAKVRVRQNLVRGEFGSPKSKRSFRFVPMADEVASALTAWFEASGYRKGDDLVFAHPETGGPMHKGKITARFQKARAAAGITGDGLTFHSLRHTFGTRCASASVPMRTLQEWMGHRDPKTTARYADYAPSSREAEMIAGAFAREESEAA